MRLLPASLALIAVLSLPALAGAGESTVTLDGGVAGTLTLPDGASSAPAVLMLHGFGSSRDEVGGMYAREAAALAKDGIASLRIDFRGFGKSDGDTGATTIDGQLEDAKVAAAFLAKQPGIDAKRLGILGFSLGGGIATLAAAGEGAPFKSLVTWSSVGDFAADMKGSVGEKAVATAAKEGVVGLDLGWRTIVLKKGFFDSLDSHKIDAAVSVYPGAYLAIAGAKDFSAAYPEGFAKLAKGSPKEVWIVPEGDHIFGSLGDDQAMADGVINKTAAWFKKTL
ncbi:MAG: alpha/beta fold hydrolase [Candidatus Kaistia colombiensis]|nr:MAG: alpha/beta fold hydrolase [Kaistia sp.]